MSDVWFISINTDMKNNRILSAILVTGILFPSCNDTAKAPVASHADSMVPSPDPSTQVDDITTDTLVNSGGMGLSITTNNTRKLIILNLDHEQAVLALDTTAHGLLKAYNDHYIYTNEKGQVEIRKDGELIFSGEE
jgi:hypothetical protein